VSRPKNPVAVYVEKFMQILCYGDKFSGPLYPQMEKYSLWATKRRLF